MLRENPRLRPNIYQVLQEVCLLRGTDVPIEDVSYFHIDAVSAYRSRYMAPQYARKLGETNLSRHHLMSPRPP